MKLKLLFFCVFLLHLQQGSVLRKKLSNRQLKKQQILNDPKVQRLLKGANKKERRKLLQFFLTTKWTAEELRWDQQQRFKDIMRTSIDSQQKQFDFERQMDFQDHQNLEEVAKIYDTLKNNISSAKELLLDQMDNIYNNIIAPGRWHYQFKINKIISIFLKLIFLFIIFVSYYMCIFIFKIIQFSIQYL